LEIVQDDVADGTARGGSAEGNCCVATLAPFDLCSLRIGSDVYIMPVYSTVIVDITGEYVLVTLVTDYLICISVLEKECDTTTSCFNPVVVRKLASHTVEAT